MMGAVQEVEVVVGDRVADHDAAQRAQRAWSSEQPSSCRNYAWHASAGAAPFERDTRG